MNPRRTGGDGGVRLGLAVTSLILGILANLGLWFVSGIPAIITGHVAVRRARQAPDRHGGASLAVAGLVLGYLSLVLGTVVAVFLMGRLRSEMMGAPHHALGQAQEIRCLNNLKELGLAARLYAREHGGLYPPDVAALGRILSHHEVLQCPADDRHRTPGSGNSTAINPTEISYEYLTPGAAQVDIANQPAFRCRIHGNVALGDGRVTRGEGPAQ